MANDDRRSEQFIREVDEEFRRAQLKALWDRFAPLIIGVCVLVVAVTAGYRGWMWWEERRAARAGDRFMAAVQAIESGDRAAGEAELRAIAAEEGSGYSALARLRLAGELAAADKSEEAISEYDAIAADGSVPGAMRDTARIRGALLALDSGDLAGARERAEPLDQPGATWRHAAREVLGIAAYQSGDFEGAREHFTAIQQDAQAPPELWRRAGMMLALIDGQLAAPLGQDESGSGATGSGPAATGSAPSPAGTPPPVEQTPAAGPPPSEAPIPPQ
jgi:hypothetical protein